MGTIVLCSLHFLDVGHCSAGALANGLYKIGCRSKYRGGENTTRDGDCEAVGEATFPYLAAILAFSP